MDSVNFEKFDAKTDEWLTAKELKDRGLINSDIGKIRAALGQYQNAFPNYIKYKRGRGRVAICLLNNPTVIEQFCARAGLGDNSTEKEWLTAQQLAGTHIQAEAKVIRDWMSKLQPDMPKYIKTMPWLRHGTAVYMLNNFLVMQWFCFKAKLTMVGEEPRPAETEKTTTETTQTPEAPAIEEKTDEWLSAGELAAYIRCSPKKLSSALKKYQSIMSDDIKPQMILCLRKDDRVIEEFRKKMGLAPTKTFKSKDWISVTKMQQQKLVSGSRNQLEAALKEWRAENPTEVCERTHKKRTVLLLRNDRGVIERFCKKMEPAKVDTINPEEWISVVNIQQQKIMSGTSRQIETALKAWQTENPTEVCERTHKKKTVLYLRNDSEIIERFRRANETPKQNRDDWLSVATLMQQGVVTGTYKKIVAALEDWQKTHPDDVFKKQRGDKYTFYLRNDSEVTKQFSEALNQVGWLSAKYMANNKVVSGRQKQINAALEEWQKNHPNDIYKKSRKNGFVLYLRNDAEVIKRFSVAVSAANVARSSSVKETGEWLSANDLEYEYIDAGYTAISEKLLILQYKMPDSIKRQETSRGQRLCLKRSAMESFCRLARLQVITMKTESWLSITELQDKKYSSDTHEKIRGILNLNKNYKPEYIQVKRQSGGKKELCLLNDPDAIAWFRRKSGLAPINKTVWINVQDLAGNYIMSDTKTIVERIKEIECDMPKDVWIVGNGDHCEIYLHRDAIPTFCKYARLKSKDDMATAINTAISAVKGAAAKSNQSQKS